MSFKRPTAHSCQEFQKLLGSDQLKTPSLTQRAALWGAQGKQGEVSPTFHSPSEGTQSPSQLPAQTQPSQTTWPTAGQKMPNRHLKQSQNGSTFSEVQQVK